MRLLKIYTLCRCRRYSVRCVKSCSVGRTSIAHILQVNIVNMVSIVENYTTVLNDGRLAYGSTYAMVDDNLPIRIPKSLYRCRSFRRCSPTGGSTQNLRITLGGQLTAKGRDLVYVLGKENFKSEVLGG